MAVKAATVAALCSWVACVVLLTAAYQGGQQNLRDTSQLLGGELAAWLSDQAGEQLVRNEHLQLQATLNRYQSNPLIAHIVVQGVDQRILAEAGESAASDWHYQRDITFQDSVIGRLKIAFSKDRILTQGRLLNQQLWLLATLLAVLVYALMLPLGNHYSRELAALRRWLLKGEDESTGYLGQDELSRLREAIGQCRIVRPQAVPSQSASSGDARDAAPRAILAIHLPELEHYREQLSESRFEHSMAHWLEVMQRVALHCEGLLSVERHSLVTVTFCGDQATLQGLRCAWLMHRLQQEGVLPICRAQQLAQVEYSAHAQLLQFNLRVAAERAFNQVGELEDGAVGIDLEIAEESRLTEQFDLDLSLDHARMIAPHGYLLAELERELETLEAQPADSV